MQIKKGINKDKRVVWFVLDDSLNKESPVSLGELVMVGESIFYDGRRAEIMLSLDDVRDVELAMKNIKEEINEQRHNQIYKTI